MDMKCLDLPILFFLIFSVTLSAHAEAQNVLQKLKEIWEDPVLQESLDANIKANRMGDFYIVFDKKVENARIEQIEHEFLFGAYASRTIAKGLKYQDYSEEQIDKYASLYKNLFNYGTVAVVWKRIEPERGKMRWDYSNDKNIDISLDKNPTVTQPDIALKFCEDNSIAVKGHCLSWMISTEHFIPEWAIGLKESEVENALTQNIDNISQRYSKRISIWDVVNEAADYIQPNAVAYHDYIFKAFEEAKRTLGTNSTFLINETSAAWEQYCKNGETGRYYLLIKELISRGAKVDAIGLQFHIFGEGEWKNILAGKQYTPYQLQKALSGYASLQRPIHITEITIPSSREGGEDAQAYYAKNVYKLWFANPNVEAITWWNMRDGQAAPNEKHLQGGLLRADLTKKPIYYALDELINKQWHTCVDYKTPVSRIHINAFYGKYRITYSLDGKEYNKEIWLEKKSDRMKKIATSSR